MTNGECAYPWIIPSFIHINLSIIVTVRTRIYELKQYLKSVESIIVAYNRVNTKTLIHTGFKLKSNSKPIKLVKK